MDYIFQIAVISTPKNRGACSFFDNLYNLKGSESLEIGFDFGYLIRLIISEQNLFERRSG